jgi:arginine:pyruvate transaminase
MRHSSLVQRVAGEGAEAWQIYFAATKAQRAGRDIINLCIGDPNFDAPSKVIDRAVAGLRGRDTHYADIPGRPRLRAAIARDFQSRSGVPTAPENTIVLAGAQNALFAVCQCLFDRGDEVITPEPTYVTYEATIQASGATIVRVPSPAAREFHIDLDALRAAVTPRTRGIVFCNPNNPTGVVMSREELEAIADVARRADIWVVSDEVYRTLTFVRPHLSFASLPGMAERTMTISSLSKSHAMPGFRAGWAIGPTQTVHHVETLSLCMLYGLPGFIQEAAIVAIEDGDADAEEMHTAYRRRREAVVTALSRVQTLRVLNPEGGMFVLAGVEATGLTAQAFAWKLLEETGVAVLPADAFGPSARGHLRISLGLDEEPLAEACRRITRFCEVLRAKA